MVNVKKIISYSIGPAGGAIVSFFTLPIVARYFDSYIIGQFSMLQVIISFSVMIFGLGLYQSYVREYHEVTNKNELLILSLMPVIIFFILTSIVVAMIRISLSKTYLGWNWNNSDFYLLLTIFICLMNNSFIYVIRMEERPLAFSLNQLLPKLSYLGFVLLLIFFGFEQDFKYLWLANFISVSMSFLLLFYLIKHNFNNLFFASLDLSKLWNMLSFSIPLIFSGLAYWGLTTLDRVFLKEYSNYNELGIYAVAISFGGVASVIASVFSSIWQPMVYRWVSTDKYDKRFFVAMNMVTVGVAFIWSALGCCAWLSKIIMPIQYAKVESIFIGCISIPLLFIISETTQVGIGIMRRSVFSFFSSLCALICNIILNIILIPRYGANGAAISTAISFLLFLIIRTESSVFLWHKFSRWRIYVTSIFYVGNTVLINLFNMKPLEYILIWSMLFAAVVFIFHANIVDLYKDIKKIDKE